MGLDSLSVLELVFRIEETSRRSSFLALLLPPSTAMAVWRYLLAS
jgi:aryl carrier-like protein